VPQTSGRVRIIAKTQRVFLESRRINTTETSSVDRKNKLKTQGNGWWEIAGIPGRQCWKGDFPVV